MWEHVVYLTCWCFQTIGAILVAIDSCTVMQSIQINRGPIGQVIGWLIFYWAQSWTHKNTYGMVKVVLHIAHNATKTVLHILPWVSFLKKGLLPLSEACRSLSNFSWRSKFMFITVWPLGFEKAGNWLKSEWSSPWSVGSPCTKSKYSGDLGPLRLHVLLRGMYGLICGGMAINLCLKK